MSEPGGAPDLFGDVDHPEWGPDVVWPIYAEAPSAWWLQPGASHD